MEYSLNISILLILIFFFKTQDKRSNFGNSVNSFRNFFIALGQNRKNTQIKAYITDKEKTQVCINIFRCSMTYRAYNLLVQDICIF